jgi:hypothetical protein
MSNSPMETQLDQDHVLRLLRCMSFNPIKLTRVYHQQTGKILPGITAASCGVLRLPARGAQSLYAIR